ncbi:MAG: alpha/beta hydrolase [Pseudoduganella sp.]|jgi:pimeloyl-ACP methyl ester carboxylesterase|nr:alpha/beta hydrolase [Pseudoduganella sp.]
MAQCLTVDGVTVHVDGTGEEVIMMIHGWPYDRSLWDAQVAAFAPTYRCVRFSFPSQRGKGSHTLDEVTKLYADTVMAVSDGRPVILMLSDWGCVFGYQFALRYPELVSRVIGVGIGGSSQLTYRASLDWTTRLRLAFAQRRLSAATSSSREARAACARLQLPHVITWLRASHPTAGALPFKLRWPMLYIYGKRKPFSFHTRTFEAAVQSKPDSRVIAFRSGHWVMREQPEAFNSAVKGWLQGA